MDAGAYRNLVTIQKRTVTTNGNGFDEETWTDYYSNYAYINKLSGTEFWKAAETAAQNTVRFTFRWHADLDQVDTIDYRILFGCRIFNITNVDNVQFLNEIVKISGTEVL